MTFRRVVNRGGLQDGGYDIAPQAWAIGVNLDSPGIMEGDKDSAEFFSLMGKYWRERLQQYDTSIRMLAGDLRRLERDGVDEKAICRQIAVRTGVDVDIVAIVLKEFLTW